MDKVIKLKEETINKLGKYRTHPRETWNDIILRLLQEVKGGKE